jgi:hypothetical protein
MPTLRDTYRRSRWVMPAFAVALGVVFFVAQWIGDDLSGGLVSLAIMTGFAAVLLALEGRSGTAPGRPATNALAASTLRPPPSQASSSSRSSSSP